MSKNSSNKKWLSKKTVSNTSKQKDISIQNKECKKAIGNEKPKREDVWSSSKLGNIIQCVMAFLTLLSVVGVGLTLMEMKMFLTGTIKIL